jgi:hypothetical protein
LVIGSNPIGPTPIFLIKLPRGGLQLPHRLVAAYEDAYAFLRHIHFLSAYVAVVGFSLLSLHHILSPPPPLQSATHQLRLVPKCPCLLPASGNSTCLYIQERDAGKA